MLAEYNRLTRSMCFAFSVVLFYSTRQSTTIWPAQNFPINPRLATQ